MRSPISEYITHQGAIIPTVTLSSSPGQSQCPTDLPQEQTSVLLSGNESPHSSPKHSPKQTSKSKESLRSEGNGREPSPFTSDRLDSDQQDNISRSSDSTQTADQGRSSIHERSSKERKESRASDRSKKKSWYNALFSTYKSRSEEFKKHFKDVPSEERLVVDYSCALQRDILVQGRLYITQNYLCFYANIFRWETCVCIKWKDVSSVTKEKTALVIPNAILVSTDTEKHFFTTFAARDKAYVMLFRVWQNALMDKPLTTQELWQLVHTAYGEELGLTSEDEDYNYIPPGTSFDEKLSPVSVRLSANSLPEGCSGLNVEKGGSEVGSSASETTNKSHGSMSHQQDFLPVHTAQIATEALPTDMSDNSTESDAEGNVGELLTKGNPRGKVSTHNDDCLPLFQETKMPACTSSHEGRLIVNTVLPMHVDQLFQLLFTNSKFLVEFHSLRRTTDFRTSSWQKNPDTDEKTRTLSMVVALSQSIGPRSSSVHETQILQSCSRHGQLYCIDGEVVNSGIPYSDSFYVVKHYCLEKASETETSLNVYAQLKYKKNVWTVMKNVIERNTWAGLEEFYDALIKALLAECDEAISKGRKGRRRHRGISAKPNLLPMDQIATSGRGSSSSDGEKRTDILLYIVLAVLVFLVLLNGLLYYKLWVLEDWKQSSRPSSIWHTDLDILKNPPKTYDEWLKALRQQESLHRMELDKWQQVLKHSVQLLRKAEESLNGLRGSIKSPYPDDVTVLERKDKQEL